MNVTKSKAVIIFFLTAFLLPGLCVILIFCPLIKENQIISLILYGVEAASPAIATLFAVTLAAKKHSFKNLGAFLKEKYINNFSLTFTLIGIILPIFIYTASKLISLALEQSAAFSMPTANKMLIILWSLISEEIAWRGFLQDRVEERFGTFFTPFIIAAIWALWHYHFFISTPTGAPVYLFLISCIAESCGYYTLTKLSKGNVIPASIAHCAGNFLIAFLLLNPDKNGGNTTCYLIYTIVSLIYIPLFLFFLLYKKRSVPKKR